MRNRLPRVIYIDAVRPAATRIDERGKSVPVQPGWRNLASEVLLEPQGDREPVIIADGVVADGVVARLDLEGGGAGLRI